MRISDPSKVPNGWYTYTQEPEGGLTRPVPLQAHTVGLLYSQVRELRLANGIPLEYDFPRPIEEDFCKRRPELCSEHTGEQPVRHIAFKSVLATIVATLAIPAADALTVIGKALGVHCAQCQIRNQVIHKIEELGVVETLRRVMATFKKA